MNDTAAAPANGWERRRLTQLLTYERIALQLFAERGYHAVTFDDIAEVAGVSARTLFRYFPTKEDFLLGQPRRQQVPLLQQIASLPLAADPFPTAWTVIRDHFLVEPPDLAGMQLWRAAAADAPEVHARVKGDHQQALLDAFTAYAQRCLGTSPSDDLRARLTAGVLVGMEIAMIEMLGRSALSAEEIVEITERTLATVSGIALVGATQADGRA